MEDTTFRSRRHVGGAGVPRGLRVWLQLAVIALIAAAAMPVPAQQPGPVERAAERVDERVDAVTRYIEAYVSDDSLQAQYVQELRIENFGPVEVGGGFFYNETRDLIAVVDGLLYIGDQADRRQIEVNVGTRLYGAFLNEENEDTFAVGFGGEAEFFFTRDQRSSLQLTAFYAPDILTFGIANNVQDVSLRLQTRIREATQIFVGYRALEIETTLGDREVDDNAHIGFRRNF
jgi:hypothetical protein